MASLVISGNTSGQITITAPAVAGTGTLTLPVATDTLVGKATTDTLTNKTLTTPVINGTITGTTVIPAANGGTGVANNAAMTVTGSGNFAYTRTLTAATNVTFPTTGTLATLAGSESLTNKTLASPTLSGTLIGSGTIGGSTVINTSGTLAAGATTITGTITTTLAQVITGTTTNDSAAAGKVGEYIESVVANVAAGATGVIADFTSISLTAGDWDVTVVTLTNSDAVGAVTVSLVGVSTTTGNSFTGLTVGSNRVECSLSGTSGALSLVVPSFRVSLSATTTMYGKHYYQFTGTTPKTSGRLSARRVR